MYQVLQTGTDEDLLVEEPSADYGYTYADYLQWNLRYRIELFKGRIFRLSAPNTNHQKISGKLYLSIGNFLNQQPCQVFSAPFDVRLPIKNKKRDDEVTTVVQPDLCIICDPLKLDERGCNGAPDLVIEILSPGNNKKEVKLKFDLYEEAGVKEYWIVYPAEENIITYFLNDQQKFVGGKIYASGDTIHSKAVAGLSVNLDEIF